jgi:uncharacterized protein (TIGR02266 family)
MTTFEKNRKFPRVELILKITYPAKEDFLADYAANASQGGLFIVTSKPFEIGEEVTFTLSFPGLLHPLQCRGEVRWRLSPEQAGEDQRAGIGVAFLEDFGEDAERVRAVLSGLDQAPDDEPDEATSIDDPIGPFRVLLADHDQEARNTVEFALEKYRSVRMASGTRLEVDVADDGNQAWSLLKSKPFDLAVIDMEIPDLEGKELISRIREDNRLADLPIIAIDDENEAAKTQADESGADFFMGKPLLLTQLFESLQRMLSARST